MIRAWIAISLFLSGLELEAQPAARPTVGNIDTYGVANRAAPGQFLFIAGTGFGTATSLATLTTAVQIAGLDCPVFAVSTTLVICQVPVTIPLGIAALVVTGPGGASAPFSIPVAAANPGTAFLPLFQSSLGRPNVTPSPGDHVFVVLDGLGVQENVNTTEVRIDGQTVPVVGIRYEAVEFFSVQSGQATHIRERRLPELLLDFPPIRGGPHVATFVAAGISSGSFRFSSLGNGLLVSQTGLRFNGVAAGPALPQQTVNVISQSVPFNFALSTSTLSGGNWLTATPAQGSAQPNTAGVPILVGTNTGGLAAGTYYGSLRLTSLDVTNSPVTVTVVLNVSAANTALPPQLDRTGLVFVAPPGGTAPVSQNVGVFNPTPNPVAYTATTSARPQPSR